MTAACVRAVIMPYGGYPTDIASFKAWAAMLARNGPGGFYGSTFVDYLPGYLYVLWGIGLLEGALRLNPQALLFLLKLPAAVADILGAVLIKRLALSYYVQTRPPDAGSGDVPLAPYVLAVSYLFHPALIFTGAYWGQVDSVGALLALTALALFQKSSRLTWPVAAAAFLVKPQTAPLLTVLAVAELSRARKEGAVIARAGQAAVLGLATIALLTAPFRLGPRGLFKLVGDAVGVYPYGSVMAFNFWGAVQGFWEKDGIAVIGVPLSVWGLALTVSVMGILLVGAWHTPDHRTVLLAGAAALVAGFILPTRIHERYLLPALPFLALAPVTDRRWTAPYVWLSILLMLNLVYAYTRPNVGTFILPGLLERTVFSEAGARALSGLAAITLPYLVWLFVRRERPA